MQIYLCQVSRHKVYLLMGFLVFVWVGLLAKDAADACSEEVDILCLLPVEPLFLKLLLSLLTLADKDLCTYMQINRK